MRLSTCSLSFKVIQLVLLHSFRHKMVRILVLFLCIDFRFHFLLLASNFDDG